MVVNNEIESDFHPLDVDEDGVIDEGPLAGTNHPADPFDIPHDEFVSRLRSGVADWYTEVTYGSVYLDQVDLPGSVGGWRRTAGFDYSLRPTCPSRDLSPGV